jgi:LysR family transcriptional regulator, regulator of abg operon
VIVSGAGSHWRHAASLRALSEAPWIRIRSDDRADELSELFETHGLAPPPQTCLASSMLTVFLLLRSIDALALVPRSWPELSPENNLFAPLAVGESLGTLDLCTMHRPALPLTPAAQALFDQVISVLRQDE